MKQARLSEQTVKLIGYQYTICPEDKPDNPDLQFHNELLRAIIFGLWNQKMELLAKKGWPPQPVHQKEIFKEYKKRIIMYKNLDMQLELKGKDRYWPSFARVHDHNWVERRVNYLATKKFGPKNESGVLKIINPTAGYYQPNPEIFAHKQTKTQ